MTGESLAYASGRLYANASPVRILPSSPHTSLRPRSVGPEDPSGVHPVCIVFLVVAFGFDGKSTA